MKRYSSNPSIPNSGTKSVGGKEADMEKAPYKVLIFSKRIPEKPLEELTEWFATKKGAEDYARIFCNFNPKYRAEIYHEKENDHAE